MNPEADRAQIMLSSPAYKFSDKHHRRFPTGSCHTDTMSTTMLFLVFFSFVCFAFACPAGPGRDEESGLCETCPPGTFSIGDDDCIPCAVGTFNPNFGAQIEELCRPCLKNTFDDKVGARSCKPCPKGTFSNRGHRRCIKCGAGYFVKRIPNNFFNLRLEEPVCIPCIAGRYSAGNNRCILCPYPLVSRRKSKSLSDCRMCPS